jgi:metallo-beta-lactamase class B
VTLVGLAAAAQAQNANPMVIVPPAEARYVPIDPTRPDGAAVAVLRGNPDTGPSAMLLKVKKGPGRLHVHTSDYHLVVVAGMVKHWDANTREADAPALPPGTFWFQPGNEPHADSCLSDECVMYVQWEGRRDGRLAEDAVRSVQTPPPCDASSAWNATRAPFRIHGNTYYVGTAGLSALLVTSSAGHVLIDGALPESAPVIAENVRALGFRVEDIEVIVNSHAHFDHAGGIAALQRLSGARVMASPWSARVLRRGASTAEDPQYGLLPSFARSDIARELADGDTVRVGDVALRAIFTPGHTPGGTSWSWRSCENDRCLDFVYADSQTPISADDFFYSRTQRSTYPTALADFERGLAAIGSLPCDVLITPHPGITDLFARIDRRSPGESVDLRSPGACRAFVASARERIAQRVASERAKAP